MHETPSINTCTFHHSFPLLDTHRQIRRMLTESPGKRQCSLFKTRRIILPLLPPSITPFHVPRVGPGTESLNIANSYGEHLTGTEPSDPWRRGRG